MIAEVRIQLNRPDVPLEQGLEMSCPASGPVPPSSQGVAESVPENIYTPSAKSEAG